MKWTQSFVVFKSWNPGNLYSGVGSTSLGSPSLSEYYPFGIITVFYVILTIYAFNKCFSFPKKYGFIITSASKLPVNIYLIYLATFIYYGVTNGNSIQSPFNT